MIITLSSTDWRAENLHPNGAGTPGQTLVAPETLRGTPDSLRTLLVCHTTIPACYWSRL